MNANANENIQSVLPQTFVNRFHAICSSLFTETFDHLEQGLTLSRPDKVLRKEYEQIRSQMNARQIGLGFAIDLLVKAIETHAVKTRRFRSSDARLQRALTTFRDQELRNFETHFKNVAEALTNDPSSFRKSFVTEMHGYGYIDYRQQGNNSVIVATPALRDRMIFPLEIAPDDYPMTGDFQGLFRKG